jgi:hypothetical protein
MREIFFCKRILDSLFFLSRLRHHAPPIQISRAMAQTMEFAQGYALGGSDFATAPFGGHLPKIHPKFFPVGFPSQT